MFLHVLISMPFLLFQFLVPQRYFDVLEFSFYHVVKVGQMSHHTQTRTLIESRSHGCFVLFLCLMSYGPQWSQLIRRARKFLEILLQFGNNSSIVVSTLCLFVPLCLKDDALQSPQSVFVSAISCILLHKQDLFFFFNRCIAKPKPKQL